MFITFEGSEGSGKTSQLPLLAESLRQQGCSVLTTREPGGTPIVEQIRKVILDLKNTEMHPRTEILLFQAARAQQAMEYDYLSTREWKMAQQYFGPAFDACIARSTEYFSTPGMIEPRLRIPAVSINT